MKIVEFENGPSMMYARQNANRFKADRDTFDQSKSNLKNSSQWVLVEFALLFSGGKKI